MAYISLAELKTYMGIPTSDTTADTKLQTFIDAAQKFIENYTGKVFEASATSTRYFHAIEDVDGFVLFLDRDLANITSLVVVNGDGETIPGVVYFPATLPKDIVLLLEHYVWNLPV
jgi:CTP:phosphocholine cytidylyltransferase-like protein